MAYTVQQVRDLIPGVQFAGGKAAVRIEHTTFELGFVGEDGAFFPSIDGKKMLESAKVETPVEEAPVAEDKPKRGRPKSIVPDFEAE